jgi:hypothetical protein
MLARDRLLLATALPAFGQVNVNFTTGNTPATAMDIITGRGGYITVIDDAALEPANNFEFKLWDTWVDATAGMIGNDLIEKTDAFNLYVSAANTITAQEAATAFASNTSDAYTTNTDAVYNTAKTDVNADSVTTGNDCFVGQLEGGGSYQIFRSYLYFDTSAIPNGATISSAVLRIYGKVDSSTGSDFDIVVTDGQPLHPADPAVVGDYDESLYAGNGGVVNTATYTTIGYNDITLNAAGIGWINDTGTTKLTLRSSRDIAGNVPGGATNEFVTFHNFDAAGTANDPQLVITLEGATVAGVASGEHDITVSADGTNMTLTIDAIAPDTVLIMSIPANANNWVIGANNVTPYTGYYKHTVGGVLIAHYEPNVIIGGQVYAVGTVTVTNGDATVTGAGGAAWTDIMENGLFKSTDGVYYTISDVTSATTLELSAVYGGGTLAGQAYNMYVKLPDRQGTEQPGIITWGTNPAGTTMSVASLSAYSGAFTDTSDTTPPDRLAEVPVSDWYGDNTVTKAATLANPFRPIVLMVSDNTTLTEIQTWRWYGIGILIAAVAMFAKLARGHQGITAIAAGAIVALLMAFDSTIFPLYLAVLSAGLIIGGLISERSHQI